MASQGNSQPTSGRHWGDSFVYLVLAYLDGVASADEFRELQTALRQDAEKRDLFVSLCLQASQIRELEHPQHNPIFTGSDTSEDPGLEMDAADLSSIESSIFAEEALAGPSEEKAAWEIEAQKEAIRRVAERAFDQFKEKELRRQEELALRQYRAKQRQLFVVAGCAAVLLIIMALAWIREFQSRRASEEVVPGTIQLAPPVLAHISKSRHARWQGGALAVDPGTTIKASSLRLEQGLVEMIFTSGAYALLQAPCDIRLETAEQVFLGGGSLAIEIPDRANGFVVRTPTGTVVDYGTEFGVIVYATGETEAQVYQGKVALRSGSDPIRSEASRMLVAEQAGRVSTDGSIARTAFQSGRVFRVIPPKSGLAIPGVRLSLMDMLIGGNGFDTGQTDRVLSMQTGTTEQLHSRRHNTVIRDPQRCQAPLSPFINYLFVPDGGNGPIQVSSENHRWAGCPDTDGSGRALISYRGFLRDHTPRVDEMVLQGRVYDNPQHPAMAMHANRGITFDLDAIRASLPGIRIAQFSAFCGVSETAQPTKSAGCDFWVLLDGQTVFKRLGTNINSGPAPINIPCPDDARFLTLMVTDGGNGSSFDWGVFAEPVLELTARPTEIAQSNQ